MAGSCEVKSSELRLGAAGFEHHALGDAVRRSNADGSGGLHDRPRSGRPRQLTGTNQDNLNA